MTGKKKTKRHGTSRSAQPGKGFAGDEVFLSGHHPLDLAGDGKKDRRVIEPLFKERAFSAAIINAVGALIVVLDPQGRIVGINHACRKTTGYDLEQVRGEKFWDVFLLPDEMGLAKDSFQRIISESLTPTYESHWRSKNGNHRLISWSTALSLGKSGQCEYVIITGINITGQKQVEKELRQKERFLSNIFNCIRDGISILDQDLNIIMANPTMEGWYGHSASIVGKKCYEVNKGRSEACEVCHSRQTLETGQTTHVTVTRKDSEGNTIGWMDHYSYPLVDMETGTTKGVIEYIRDITEQRRVEEALQASEEQMRVLIEASPIGIGLIRQGIIGYANPALAAIYGCEDHWELAGWPIEKLYVPADRALIQQVLRHDLRQEGALLVSHEACGQRKDNKIISISVWWTEIKIRGARALLGFFIDSTEDKTLRAQLLQAQKMKALGALVAGVAHEINNPLNLIMLNMPLMRKIWTDFAPILKEHAWRSPEALYGGLTYGFLKDHFEPLLMDVEMATQRIARIVTQLKDFSRQSKVNEVGPVQLNEAVENAARLSMSTVKKSGVQLELNLDRELPSMEGNLPCLEQVTLNLIINAFEAIDHPNGRIAVTTQLEPSTQRIILSVADNGRGVHPTIAEQIFDPFVTDKQNQGGTGLGLAITYNLVKAHRGDIEFQSRRGSGTTFTVTFPIEGEGSTAWNICHLENQPF